MPRGGAAKEALIRGAQMFSCTHPRRAPSQKKGGKGTTHTFCTCFQQSEFDDAATRISEPPTHSAAQRWVRNQTLVRFVARLQLFHAAPIVKKRVMAAKMIPAATPLPLVVAALLACVPLAIAHG